MKKNAKIATCMSISGIALLLLLAPSVIGLPISSATVARTSGVWSLPNFNATTLKTSGDHQYIASYGSGPIKGGIVGQTTASLLLDYNTKTNVIIFTGQIECVCTVDGRSGILWIAITNGIDHNASNPNGRTTADLLIVGSSGGLAGTTGQGVENTTTSSPNMDYAMKIHLG
jgi:hypothetical protein